MSENKSKVELSIAWLDDAEVEEVEETVFGGSSESPYVQGYGAVDAKISMAYKVESGSSKAEAIKISFVTKDEKTHSEVFWVRGKDGKPYSMKNGKKVQTFGVNKIKSLIKVCGLFADSKNVMAFLYADVDTADVTETNYGKEETEEREVFNALVGCKVKLCTSSKKVNSTTSKDKEDSEDIKYVAQCIKDAKKFCIANPKKKSIVNKVKKESDYVSVYKWHTETSIQHFCSTDGLFAGETEGKKLQEFLDANDEGFVSDGRALRPEELSEKERKKLSINEYGKQVEAEDSDGYEEPEEAESEDESEEW